MQLFIPSNKVPFSLTLGIKTRTPERIKIQVLDNRKPATFYVNRSATIKKYREFELNLPVSPKAAILRVYNLSNGDYDVNVDQSFQITKLEPSKLKECPLWMNKETRSFVRFAQQFSDSAGVLSAGNRRPHIYRSDDAKYHIDYYNVIRDRKSGQPTSTPARIGHTTGIIEVSKRDFVNYTVPMRMIILLHEFSHKHLNNKIGKPIEYETGADINALNIYLSLGYSPLEAHYAFLKVFNHANNEDNRKRYLIIQDFIDKFTKGELNNCIIGGNREAIRR